MVFLTIERRAISSLKVFTVAVSEKMLSKAWMLCSVTVPWPLQPLGILTIHLWPPGNRFHLLSDPNDLLIVSAIAPLGVEMECLGRDAWSLLQLGMRGILWRYLVSLCLSLGTTTHRRLLSWWCLGPLPGLCNSDWFFVLPISNPSLSCSASERCKIGFGCLLP